MQINTIEVRIDSVDRPHVSKKDGKEELSSDTTFAAFFAQAQHGTSRVSTATANSENSDQKLELDETGATSAQHVCKCNEEVKSDIHPTEDSAAHETGKSKTVQQANAEMVEAAGPHFHAKQVPAETNEGKVGRKFGAPRIQRMAAEGTDAVEIASQAPQSETVTMPSTQIMDTETLAVRVQTVTSDRIAVKPAPAELAQTGSVRSEEVDVAAPETVPPELKTGGPAGKGAISDVATTVGQRTTPRVSKPETHAVTRVAAGTNDGLDNVKLSSEASPETDSVANAGGPAKADPNTGTAAPKTQEALSKSDFQVIRTVTQLVSADGSIVATQTAEKHVGGVSTPSPPEAVIVERTSLQALPEQTLRVVRYLSNNGEQTMRIRLVPESLGEVRIEVTTSHDAISIKLASANTAVREILQTHAQGLQTALAQDNASAVRVSITSDAASTAWLLDNAQRHDHRHEPPAQQRPASTPYQSAGRNGPTPMRREFSHNGNLNVYV